MLNLERVTSTVLSNLMSNPLYGNGNVAIDLVVYFVFVHGGLHPNSISL